MAGRIRDEQGDDMAESHEINVTPFIDVMLVLLIIFMVAAPLSTVDVPVDLPGSNATRAEPPQEPIYLTLQKDLTLSLAEQSIAPAAVTAQLDLLTGGNRDTRIYLRADEAVPYGDLMDVMNLLRAGSYLKVALVGVDAVPGGLPLPGTTP
jgi:biopolymer transport protein ExbD